MGSIKAFPRGVSLLLTAAFLLLTLAGCGGKDSPLGKTFRFPLSAEPRQIDPQVSRDAPSVTAVAALFEGLTRLDDQGKAVPGAADWTVSPDGLIYTFTLRDSKWSDGAPVTAADFVFGMQRAVSPATGSALAELLFGIQNAREVNAGALPVEELGVEAAGERTVVVTLTEPDSGFPEKAAGTPFMPCNQAFFEGTQGRYGMEVEYVLTNGPFLLAKWAHNQYLRLEKHEGYHGRDDVYPAAVVYRIGLTGDPLEALQEGDLDAAELTPEQAEAARLKGLRVIELEDTVQFFWLNTSVQALSAPAIRRALREGLEWDSLREQLNTTVYEPATGFVAPDAVVEGGEKYRRAENPYVTDVDRARRDLSAGLAFLELEALPRLTVLCADDDYSQRLALYAVQSWQKNLKVYMDIQPVGDAELASRVEAGNYQIALYASTAPGLSAMEALGAFTSGASRGNLSRLQDTGFDTLFTELSGGSTAREELDRLEHALNELCPAIPLAFQRRYVGLPQTVTGVTIRPFGGGAYGAAISFRHAGKTKA